MTAYSNKASGNNRFRIIAGQWRHRVLRFPGDIDALRPTSDRIRETLFNWLQRKTPGARCLDLFAGSGALAFEAASRGAASITALELSQQAAASIRSNCELLNCTNLDIINADALNWLKNAHGVAPYDIVFLDPPFGMNALPECCRLLAERNLLAPGAIVYMESSAPLAEIPLPDRWHWLRNKKAGQVYFGVCEHVMD